MKYLAITFFAALGLAAAGNLCTSRSMSGGVVAPYVELDGATQTGSSVGAGVVITYRGAPVVLTARHVCDMAPYITARKFSRRSGTLMTWRLNKLRTSKKYDLGLLTFDEPATAPPPAKFTGKVRYDFGTPVWYIGSPWGEHAILEESLVAHPCYRVDDHFYIATNGSMWYGNSGGGMFAKVDGEYVLIGINVRRMNMSDRSQGLAESQENIQEFLSE